MSGTKTAPTCAVIPQTVAAKPEHHKIHLGKRFHEFWSCYPLYSPTKPEYKHKHNLEF